MTVNRGRSIAPAQGGGRKELKLNEKFKYLFEYNKRYIVYYGGRGSGKSTSIALAIVSRMMGESGLRVLCVRQFNVTVTESCYQQVIEACEMLGVSDRFTFTKGKVLCNATQSVAVFHGIDRNKSNIKGFVNCSICWVEEASDIPHESWKFLIPTIIRNNNAIFFISFNPNHASDYAYNRWVVNSDPHAVVNKINYVENKYCSVGMLEEAESDKNLDYDNYLHVWEGFPRVADKNAVIQVKWFKSAIQAFELWGDDNEGRIRIGFDVADEGNDTNAMVYSRGNVVFGAEQWTDNSPNSAAGKCFSEAVRLGAYRIDFDSLGVGAGAKGEFRRLGEGSSGGLLINAFAASGKVAFKDRKYKAGSKNKDVFANLKAQAWFDVRDRFISTHEAVEKGEQIENAIMIDSKAMGSAEYIALENELTRVLFETKNGKIKIQSKSDSVNASENLADAFIMATYNERFAAKSVWL